MAPNIRVPEGNVFVPRRTGENVALELLTIAEKVGVDRFDVKTVSGGYHVPTAVADEYAKGHPAADEPEEAEGEAEGVAQDYPAGDPSGEWTVKQLEAWAAAQDPAVDLGTGDKASKVQAALDSIKS